MDIHWRYHHAVYPELDRDQDFVARDTAGAPTVQKLDWHFMARQCRWRERRAGL